MPERDCFVVEFTLSVVEGLLAMTKGCIRRHCERGAAERGNLVVVLFLKWGTGGFAGLFVSMSELFW